MFPKQDSLPYNGIKFDKGHFVLGIGNIFSCSVEESCTSGAEQLDGNGFSLSACQEGDRRMHTGRCEKEYECYVPISRLGLQEGIRSAV